MCAERTHFEDLDGDACKVHRARGRGKMHDRIDLSSHIDVIGDVVMDELESPLPGEVCDVIDRSSNQVIHRNHLVTICQQTVTQM